MIRKIVKYSAVAVLLIGSISIAEAYPMTVPVQVCEQVTSYNPNDDKTGNYNCTWVDGVATYCEPAENGNSDGSTGCVWHSVPITIEIPEGVTPEQVAALAAELADPDSPDKKTKDDANGMDGELDGAIGNSKDTTVLDQLKAEMESQIKQAKKDAQSAENNQCCAEYSDPVQLASGQFVTESSDISYSFINTLIDLKRGYQSYPLFHKSLGNWWFSYDTRIILGIKYNAVGIADQAFKEYKEAKGIYDVEYEKYTTLMGKLDDLINEEPGKPKGKLIQWRDSLVLTIAALNSALNYPEAINYHEIRDRINQDLSGVQNVLNNYLIPFIGQVQAAKTALQLSDTKLQELKGIMDSFLAVSIQMAKEANMALSNENRNSYVFALSDSSFLLGTGNTSVTLVDENGDTHLYTTNTEPNYDSPINYPDGSINYYPTGITCTPERVNDDTLYIQADGSYIVTKENKVQYKYSFYGQLEKIVDTNGNEIELVYDAGRHLVKITDAFDRSTNIAYSGSRIAKITDPKNREVTYTYDPEGRLSSVKDPQGDIVSYEYEANFISAIVKPGEARRTYKYIQLGDKYVIDSVTDEEGYSDKFVYYPDQKYTEFINASGISEKHYYNDKNIETKVVYADGSYIEMEYDNKDNLIRQTDELGHSTLFAYDEARNIIQAADANSYSEYWKYNKWNKVSEYKDKLSNTTTYQYDSKGNLTSITFPDYTSISYGYNTKGQLVSETDQLGIPAYFTYDQYGYIETIMSREGNVTNQATDAIGNVTSITDAKSNTTAYTYNLDNKLVQLTDALGNKERYEYDHRKNLIKTTDKNGNATTMEYDKRDKLIKTTNPLGETIEYAYRDDGRIVSEILNKTATTFYTYDQRGRLASRTQKETGVTRSFEYDVKGQLISEKDPNGKTTQYFYDALGRLTRTSDPEMNNKYTEYDGKGRIYARNDANGNKTRFEFDSMDRIIRIYDPLNYYTANHYDAKGLLVTYTDKNWNTTSFEYDRNGRKTKETDPLGKTIATSYDPTGLVKTITNKRGYTTTFEYDALGRTIKETDPLAGNISYTYDPNGNTITMTDRNGNTTKYDYDGLNRAIVKTDPYLSQTGYAYNYLGKTSTITDALLNKKTYAYDELGRLIQETNPMAETNYYAYDKNSNLITATDPIGRKKENRYDKLNRKFEEINGLGEKTSFEYDPVGNFIKIIDPAGHAVQYQYDRRNQLEVETNQLGNTQSFTYDGNGNIITKTDFNGKMSENIYDPLDRLVKTKFADGTSKDMTYDETGNIVTAINQDSSLGYAYDKLGRLVRSEDKTLDKTLVYGYDPNGNRTSISWLDTGKATKYTYGKMNELLSVTDSENGTTKYQYDKLMRETKNTMPNNIITETAYDNAGRITLLRNYSQENHGKQEDIKSFAYLYNAAGERTYQVDQDGKITAYEYDKAGRLIKTLYTFGQGKEREDFAERLDMGLYPEKAKDNGWNKSRGPKIDFSAIAQYKFIDGFDKLEDDLSKCTEDHKDSYKAYKKNTNWPEYWKWLPGEGATEFATRLKLDSTTSKTLADAYEKIDSDTDKRKNRLDTNQWMWTETFTYDPSNNRTTKANGWGRIGYSYNEANRMLSSGNRTYQYDTNGNMTQEALGDAKVDYTYNPENRIVGIYNEIKGLAGKCGFTLEEGIEYSYDSFGRRIARTEYDLPDKHNKDSKQWKKESNTSYLYDGLSLTVVAELYDTNYTKPNAKNYNWDSKYSPMAEYVYAKGEIISKTDFPDYKHFNGSWYGRNGQKTYYSQDVLGSTVLLTDNFGHNKMEYTYDSFGTVYQGTFNGNYYGYTGKLYDSETGLYNYGFRDYIPGVGRWTSMDPIKAGMNWYVYVRNNPIKFVDIKGLQPFGSTGFPSAGSTSPLANPVSQNILATQRESSLHGHDETDIFERAAEINAELYKATYEHDIEPLVANTYVWDNISNPKYDTNHNNKIEKNEFTKMVNDMNMPVLTAPGTKIELPPAKIDEDRAYKMFEKAGVVDEDGAIDLNTLDALNIAINTAQEIVGLKKLEITPLPNPTRNPPAEATMCTPNP